jgi:hypothetical protein
LIKKRQALQMIPMRVGKEKQYFVVKLGSIYFSYSGAGVDYNPLSFVGYKFDATGIAAVFDSIYPGSGYRTS